MSWLFISFTVPILVAVLNGSTYFFAFSICAFGILLYFVNIFLIRSFISKNAPYMYWEDTAGKGIVPKWVSILGLIGMGFIPSGIVVLLLLMFGFVLNRA